MNRAAARYEITAPVLVVVAGGLIVIGAQVYTWLRAQGLVFPLPVCLLYTTTGIPCPTCGTTRAFLALASGHLGVAFRYQPLIMGILWVSTLLVSVDLAAWWLRKQQLLPRWLATIQVTPWSVLVILIVNWLYLVLFLSPRVQAWLGLVP